MVVKRNKAGLKLVEKSIGVMNSLNIEKKIKVVSINGRKTHLPAVLKKNGNEFLVIAVDPDHNWNFKSWKKIKKIVCVWSEAEFLLNRIFVNSKSPAGFDAAVGEINDRGFSEKRKRYQRLIIPISKKLSFFFKIQDRIYDTPTHRVRGCIRANFEDKYLDIYSYSGVDKKNYLILECPFKVSHEEFADRAFSCLVSIGYLTGKFIQGEGVYFSYSTISMELPIAVKFSNLRASVDSIHYPITSNPYGFNVKGSKGDLLLNKMKEISENEFSTLCLKVYQNIDLRASILLLLDVLKESVFTMATGMAVILESLTNIYNKEKPEYFIYVKDQKLSKKILNELRQVVRNYQSELGEHTGRFLASIDRLNQIPNSAKLSRPFELLGIRLNKNDMKAISRRNDLLHGRLSLDTSNDEISADRELYFVATKLYTLINVLILKQVGYSGYIINWPVYNNQVHKYKLGEAVFRKI